MFRALPRRRFAVLLLASVAPLGALNALGAGAAEPTVGASYGDKAFQRVASRTSGVAFRSDFDWEHENKHLYVHGYAGGGVALGDYDDDGRPDLFLTSQTGRDRLYRQASEWSFVDATDGAGLAHGHDWGTGASFADIDRDGDLDLSVCNYDAPNRLYVNAGDGTFTEEAEERGLAHRGASLMTAFADYDVDGDLDAYLVTYRRYARFGRSPRTRDVDGRLELMPGEQDYFTIQERAIDGETQRFVVQAGERDRLYRNEKGRFTEVSESAGIEGHAPGYAATWWDYDGDLLPDLYVSNDFWDADRLYHNQGDGTFVDVLADALPHTPWFSMGADFGDLDGDGLVDFLAADMSATEHYRQKVLMGDMADSRWFLESAEPRQYMRNALYLNTGTGRFLEGAYLAGLASTDWTWSVKLADLDNDGRLDVFATNGTANNSFDGDLTARLRAVQDTLNAQRVFDPRERAAAHWATYLEVPPHAERNLAFRNLGELAFEDVSEAWGLDHHGLSFGAALGDLDRDGDLDLVVNNVGDEAALYRNASERRGLVVRLVGRGGNTWGLGARATLRENGSSQVRQLAPVRGYLSSNEPLLHFAAGAADAERQLVVEWPGGHVQEVDLKGEDATLLRIVEPPGVAPERTPPAVPRSWFEPLADAGLAHRSVETPFDDYAMQPLLPAKLSQSGPGLAWGDADGDGEPDLFIGGPAGQAGSLRVRGPECFRELPGPWEEHADREDTAPLWIDADGDGRLDLFVASGGVEFPEGDERYDDRLYLTGDDATFRPAPERLPAKAPGAPTSLSTGAATAADMDRDGDLDLFLGTRVAPGRYPLSARSRLLRNDATGFVDVTRDVAPALEQAGLVTAALWSDVENDGDADLLVAREWGPVGLFSNDPSAGQVRLVERTEEAGLAARHGWWSALVSIDVDADGDLDYLVGNAGLNTKYHASAEHPARLYYGDFDGDGRSSIVEAKESEEALLPVRGLSCSSAAMPFVRERLPTFHDFASAALDEIYPEETLAAAHAVHVNELASGLLVNDGHGHFEFEPLLRLAQIAPIRGATVADFDADGRLDVALLQNEFQREPETGRWDGGLGLVLRGTADGALQPLRADASGLVVPGQGSALTRCDLDADGRADLLGAQNDGPFVALRNTQSGGRPLVVRLIGSGANPSAIGARVELVGEDGVVLTVEVHAGAGYLSQDSRDLFLGRWGDGGEVRVRWSDGSRSERAVAAGETWVVIVERE